MTFPLLSIRRFGISLLWFALVCGSTVSVGRVARAELPNLPTIKKSNVRVAIVKPELREAALKSAARIDELVAAKLKEEGLQSNGPTTDEQFVRRIYLDATGTIPTSKQTDAFLKSTSADKRGALVDAVLNSPGYSSQMYNWLADILRYVDHTEAYTDLRPYSDWLKEGLRENRPWDATVREMISSSGRVVDHPAAGYMMRDRNMPLDNLNNTVRIFLGTRIGCAQCHDHPFDRWTQQEFYQLAAFVGGVEYATPKDQLSPLQNSDLDSLFKSPDELEARVARSMLQSSRRMIVDNEKKQLRFPPTYQDKAQQGKTVTAAVIFGKQVAAVAPADRRRVLADWVVSPQNPRFALTIANRLWRKALGVGLIEPVDDLRDDTVASNPKLMEFLTAEMIRLKFDLKEFQRIIYNTKTYQSRATYDDWDAAKPYHFAGPVLRRMTAEQVWDSLLTLTTESPDLQLRPDDSKYYATFAIDPSMTAKQVAMAARQVQEMQAEQKEQRKKRLYKGNELLRASELPQPAPEGHFLRQFGQSDRTAISDSYTDGTVPQLLTLFNGPVTHMMLEGGSVIYNEVTALKSMDEKIERIFLCVLSRRPTVGEKMVAQKEIGAAGSAGYGNVIWALLNTREFIFVQ